MTSAIGEICVFIIIAQTILCFVPGESYVKYVRALLGMLLILRIMEPVLSFFGNTDINSSIKAAEESLERASVSLSLQEEREQEVHRESLVGGIEKELQTLLEECEDTYQVKKVELLEEDSCLLVSVGRNKESDGGSGGEDLGEKILIERITIGNEGKEQEGEGKEQDEAADSLKEKYSACTGIEKENIKIIFQ